MNDDVTAESTDLLQTLIRNACVNDGAPESGQETRNADVLASYLGTTGLDIEHYEPKPGRESIVARIEGSDPNAPSLLFMGHTDVVPVNEDGWSRNPFAGEIVDGFVWGRGAVDMLNLTATQAVAFRRLAESGFKPKGTLVYLGVADEEALGTWGAKYLVEHEADAVVTDYVLTESGGFQMQGADGKPRLPVLIDEKGTYWTKITVKGTPGHGSAPFRTDNALVTAAEIVRRIANFRPQTTISATFDGFIRGMGYPEDLADLVLDEDKFVENLDSFPEGEARYLYSCTHTTFSPNVIHGGVKTNVIPDTVELEVDIRTLPGVQGADARALLEQAIGEDLLEKVEITSNDDPCTASPCDTPLWDALQTVTSALVKDSALVPGIMTGGTDNRFFRRAGSVGYGFGLFSKRLTFSDYSSMFHGNDERVDQESLGLSTQMFEAVARELLG